MYNIIYSEILKLKRSKILFLLIIPAIFMMNISLSTSSEIVTSLGDRWLTFLAKTLLLACFYTPIFITILAGYIFIREYKENMAANLLTYPVSRLKIFLAKMLLMIPIISIIFLLVFFSDLIIGRSLPLNSLSMDVIFNIIKAITLSVILHFALLPTSIFVGIITKNNIFTTVFGAITFFLSLLLMQTKYCIFSPWCFPSMMIMNYFGSNTLFEYRNMFRNFDESKLLNSFIIFMVTMIISFVGCMLYFRNSEVK